MRVLIIHAHPEPKSFNVAMTHRAVTALTAAGDEVEVSDLYHMRFNPFRTDANFATRYDAR